MFARHGKMSKSKLKKKINSSLEPELRDISQKVVSKRVNRLVHDGYLRMCGSRPSKNKNKKTIPIFDLTFKGSLIAILVDPSINFRINRESNTFFDFCSEILKDSDDTAFSKFLRCWIIDGIGEMIRKGYLNPDVLSPSGKEGLAPIWNWLARRLRQSDVAEHFRQYRGLYRKFDGALSPDGTPGRMIEEFVENSLYELLEIPDGRDIMIKVLTQPERRQNQMLGPPPPLPKILRREFDQMEEESRP